MKIRYIKTILPFLLLFCLLYVPAEAQKYDVASIPPEMIKDADAVIRLREINFTINSVSSATYSIREVITILNETELGLSVYTGVSDKFITSHFDRIIIYDKDGKKVKSYGSSYLKPETFNTGTIYDDVYYSSVDPEYRTFPFTVEKTYSISYNGTFQLPDWQGYNYYGVSTEKTSFTVTTPLNYNLRYREQNLQSPVRIAKDKSNVSYSWSAENLPAVLSENYSTGLDKYTPEVSLAPSDFEIGGKKGNAATWESFGMFVAGLIKDRDNLEGPVADTVRKIIAGTSDTTEMIKRIYKYVQNRTRYVSVQVGIGGWQPIDAQKVDKTKYGDCKGLVNYTRALLKVAGIKSVYTTVRAGKYEDDIYYDFPSNQSNHIILCVPRSNDTIWLECTNQYCPFNYLSSYTDDRHALLITDKGGKLIKTPRYNASQNLQLRKANVTIDLLGNGSADISTDYNYFFFDNKAYLLYTDQESRKKSIISNIDIPGFTLVNFSVKQPDKDIPSMNESLSLKLNKYGTVMGDRILIPVNLMNKVDRLPSNVADRKMGIELMREMTFTDIITYKIPAGYGVSTVPQPVDISSPFGHYKAEITVNGNEITYKREMRYNKGVFPVSQYQQLLDFNKSISTADNAKLVLKKLT